jgi:hypothetical protein
VPFCPLISPLLVQLQTSAAYRVLGRVMLMNSLRA